MDDSILGDIDELALPELPDSVWMRLLANALDPDAPQTGLELIPTDTDLSSIPDDDPALLGDDLADLGPADSADGSDGSDTSDSDDDGSDLLGGHHDAPSSDSQHADIFGHGTTDADWHHGGAADSEPWAPTHDDDHGGF